MMVKIKIKKAKETMGEYALFVSFYYSQELVDIMKSMPVRAYNKESYEWEIPIMLLNQLKEKLLNNGYDISISGLNLLNQNTTDNINYEFKTKPLEHQLEAVNYGLSKDSFLLGDEMGLGKTKEALDIACIRKANNQVTKCLIVCGVNVLKYNWLEEIKKHTNEKGWILGQRKSKNKIRIGSTKDKIKDLIELCGDNYFMITNIETFRDIDFQVKLQQLVNNNQIQMIIIDEAHTIKNSKSKQTKGLIDIKPKYRIAMSGTFMLNKPMDLYVPLNWMDYFKGSEWKFTNTFTIKDSFGGIAGYKNMKLLSSIINQCMLRRRKEEVLNLPEKTYINELLEMTEKQKQIYDEVILGIKLNIDKIKLSHNPLVEMIRARQATGCPSIISSNCNESVKLNRLIDLVEEISANGNKCIIYSNWAQVVEYASQILNKFNPAKLTGEYNDAIINNELNKFRNDNSCKCIIGTIGKMGTGLTLTEANYVIFLDEPWNKGIKEQAADRIYRIGQKNNVTIITLLCKDTIDERINMLVEQKGYMSDMIVDGRINNNNLVDFLLN